MAAHDVEIWRVAVAHPGWYLVQEGLILPIVAWHISLLSGDESDLIEPITFAGAESGADHNEKAVVVYDTDGSIGALYKCQIASEIPSFTLIHEKIAVGNG